MKINNKLIRNFYIFHLLGAIIGSGSIANGFIAINQINHSASPNTSSTSSIYTNIDYTYTYDLRRSDEQISIKGFNKTSGTKITEMIGYSQETASKYLVKYREDGGFGDRWVSSYFNLTYWASTKITLTFTGYEEKFFDAIVKITLSGSEDILERTYTRVYTQEIKVSATKIVLYGNLNNIINVWTVANLATKK